MRIGRNRPGVSTDFIDGFSQETVLRVACSADGESLLAYKLYDCTGALVAHVEKPSPFPAGVTVEASDGQVLLSVPPGPDSTITYQLYNQQGKLLTCSDGLRTQVYPFLRMEKGKI